jgi:hypothetical protein
MAYNYKYLRSRFKPKQLESLDNYWLRVSEAAELYSVSKQTVRFWAFKNKIDSGIFKNILHVRL